MNKKEILDKLRSLDGLSNDEKAYLINLVNTKKKYGLVWEDKLEDVEEELRTKLPILKEVKDRAIVNDTEDEKHPNHILIEGDNLHALTALTFTHEDKVDLIYIDPPYNTGSQDFKYNDKFVDKEDAYRHSKWLSFMNKRLRLAQRLLKTDGVIFISINEEEFAQLKILCDEIFGFHNYMSSFTIKVRHENRILKGDKDYHEVTEFLLLYRKSSGFKTIKRVEDNTSLDLYTFEVKELIDNPEIIELDGKAVSVFEKGEYEVIRTEPSEDSLKKISIRGSIKEGNSSGRFFMKHFANKIGSEFGTLYKVPNMGNDKFDHRYFMLPTKKSRVNGDYFQGVPQDRNDIKHVPYPNFFDFVDEFNNVGYEGGVEFRNGKKPVDFIRKIIELSGIKDGCILDFFAGSGSTLHASLLQNKDDGYSRQVVMVTNNENDIANDVTYPRISNALNGYKDSRGNRHPPLQGNLRYFRSSFVDRSPTLQNKRKLTRLATDLLCIKEDCYHEVSSHYGFAENNCQVFTNQGGKYLVVVYHSRQQQEVQEQVIQFVQSLKDAEEKIRLYAFSPEKETLMEEFLEVQDKLEVVPLPEAIYNTYRQISRQLRLHEKRPVEAPQEDQEPSTLQL